MVFSVGGTSFLDPVLSPLLSGGPFFTILIVSIFVSIFVALIQKYTIDQDKLKSLKADLKRYQKKATSLMKEGKTDKAKKVQKDMMGIQSKVMRSSMKSMLYTFIPIILFVGWLGAHLSFAPIMPFNEFNVSVVPQESATGSFEIELAETLTMSSNVTVKNATQEKIVFSGISGSQGSHEIILKHQPSGEEQIIPILITTKQAYVAPQHIIQDSPVFESIIVNHEKLLIFEDIPIFKSIPWIKTWGWLGAYILLSIAFSLGLRKLFKLA